VVLLLDPFWLYVSLGNLSVKYGFLYMPSFIEKTATICSICHFERLFFRKMFPRPRNMELLLSKHIIHNMLKSTALRDVGTKEKCLALGEVECWTFSLM